MKVTDLRNAVQEITFDENKQEEMVSALRHMRRPKPYARTLRIAAAFAVCILAVGLISVPVRALVESLVLERMEKLPQEEIVETAEETQNQAVAADSVSREYTEEERKRRGELYQEYMNGRFPEREIVRVDSEEEALKYEFCFLTTTSAFYLPSDRMLTDEEILEQIDFEKKRDYALQEQHTEKIAERKAKEREQIMEVTASGGISEEQAIEKAKVYLWQLFGLNGDSMELNHYFNDAESSIPGRENTYCVNWADMGYYRYYYFFINAADGSLKSVSYSADMKERMADRPSVSEAPGQLVNVREQAESFLTDKVGIQETYEDVKTCYMINETDEKVSGSVSVLFITANGLAHLVECTWDGQMFEYAVAAKEAFEEQMKATAEATEKYYLREENKRVKIKIVEQ